MLTIYGRTNSVNVQKVLWCLAELELPYTRIDAGLEHGKNTEPWYLALNPNGKIPLLHGRRVHALGIEHDRALPRRQARRWAASARRRSRLARSRNAGWIGSSRR